MPPFPYGNKNALNPALRRSPLDSMGTGMNGVSLRLLEAGLTALLLGSSAIAYAATPAGSATPQSMLVAQATTKASPYLWSASKFAGGGISLSGFLPSEDEREVLLDGIGNLIADNTQIAAGEPDGFAENTSAALGLLGDLDTGKASFDGAGWQIIGSVGTAADAATARAAFDASPLKPLGATYQVNAPVAAVAAPDISTVPTATASPDVVQAGPVN